MRNGGTADDDQTSQRGYRPTESKYKGSAQEIYVTYDLEQKTRGGHEAEYPKVKRVYIAGNVKDRTSGNVRNKLGHQVHGVRIEYEQTRRGYRRAGYAARRAGTEYSASATVAAAAQKFAQVVEVPAAARNVHFYSDHAELPDRYREALQRVR
jgi:hypothetical protein